MKSIEFDKMQGLGNDYVYLIRMEGIEEDLPRLARDISDRHFGVGGDGLIVITRSNEADFRMIMFNADGSEAQMCGNASRCIARLVYEKGLTRKTEITLETKAGIKLLKLNFEEGEEREGETSLKIKDVSVNMGKPILDEESIPVIKSDYVRPMPKHRIYAGKELVDVHCIGMGNPHGVIFKDVDEEFFQEFGPQFENHLIWPEKANIEFVNVLDAGNIEMRVWERGTGETLACGTGACASAVACILTGKTGNEVNVKMKGGTLKIRLDKNGDVIMTGDAQHVAHGTYFWDV